MLLVGVLVYYVASGEWLSWMLLAAVAGLPWLSLVLSLPAIWSFQASPAGVEVLEQGEDAEIWLLGSCSRPMPPFKGFIRIQSCFTDTPGTDPGHHRGTDSPANSGYCSRPPAALICFPEECSI